uniref:Related to U2 small nuclear ribonucleoprotein B n=1 Tax=Melanopsichium pennsylvanicum 4 TaxID=1398559 RepID=A0A077R0Q2_9BASI|nr:related to U2 small nuclear ribonucleoprotein B [Melanopsichium pennsylvanicum 4]
MAVASSSKAFNNDSGSKAAPSPTLYVKNIQGKVKKAGQAFVVFDSLTASTTAKRGLSGFSFYGSELIIEYSTGEKSKALLRREIGQDAIQEMDLERSRTTVSKRGDKRLFTNNGDDHDQDGEIVGEVDSDQDQGTRKRARVTKGEEDDNDNNDDGQAVVRVQGIPESVETDVLKALFSRQQGYLSISDPKQQQQQQLSTTPGRGGDDGEFWSTNIKFDKKENAQMAIEKLKGIQIDPTYSLQLSLV